MKFNLSIASLCLSFLAANAANIPQYTEQCGIDNALVADNCLNQQNGTYYYSRPDSTCTLEFVCMIPCASNDLPTTSKSLRFFTKGQSYCDIQSNIDVCQSDKKYYDYKQCLLITMRMDQLEEVSSSMIENLKSNLKTKTLAVPTTTATSVPTIVRKGSKNSPFKSNLRVTQECAAENESCGGSLYPTAPNCCQEGLRCQRRNPYYSVCIVDENDNWNENDNNDLN